jgi:hypothetical protein
MSQPVKKAVKYAKPSAKLLNSRLKQEQDIKAERNKLALSSVKDIFSILNPNAGSDEDFDLTDFDCKIYFANPRAFEKLPFFKKQHVIDEMNEKLKKNWKGLDKDIKRFSLWWAYGSHGPRDGFVELHDYYTPYGVEAEGDVGANAVETGTATSGSKVLESIKAKEETESSPTGHAPTRTELDEIIAKVSKETTGESSQSARSALQMSNNALDSSQLNKRPEVPPDLPFKMPSILPTFHPTKATKVHRQPTLDPRSFGLKRLQQYREDRRMNPVNRVILVVVVFLTVLCFKQDRRVNVTGTVPEYPWEVAEREERELEEKRKAEEEASKRELLRAAEEQRQLELNTHKKKWYYLWLY